MVAHAASNMVIDPLIYYHVASDIVTDLQIQYQVASSILIDPCLLGRPEADPLGYLGRLRDRTAYTIISNDVRHNSMYRFLDNYQSRHCTDLVRGWYQVGWHILAHASIS